jgi:hypothetical protein
MGFSESPGHDGHDFKGEAMILRDQGSESLPIHSDEFAGGLGDHRCQPGGAIDDRQFANKIARADFFEKKTFEFNEGLTFGQDVHVFSFGTLVEESLPRAKLMENRPIAEQVVKNHGNLQ